MRFLSAQRQLQGVDMVDNALEAIEAGGGVRAGLETADAPRGLCVWTDGVFLEGTSHQASCLYGFTIKHVRGRILQ